jgi:hypothetical protein
MKRRLALIVFALSTAFAEAARAQPVNTLPAMSTITFPPGSNTSSANGQIAPGGRGAFYVMAKAGQTLMISVRSPAAAVSFQVFRPNAALAKANDGMPLVTGPTLPDAGPGDNAQDWIGAIPRDGNYLILVGQAPGGPPTPTPFNLVVTLQ